MATPSRNFLDLNAHGFVRTAIAVPRLRLADPARNVENMVRLHADAVARGAAVVLFPELSVSGYSLDDLHQQEALQESVLEGLERLRAATATSGALLIAGAPLRLGGRLFNCAVVFSSGELLGIVPKTYVPNYREFYEKRQFSSARDAPFDTVRCLGRRVPFGSDLLFRARENEDLCVHAEICEDVWAPIPPSTFAAFGGATLLSNLSASNITVGKSSYRRQLAAGQSAKTLSAYLYSAAGEGESTTDLAWDGQALVYENGELLAESERFSPNEQLVFADVDLQRLVQERSRVTSFIDCATEHGEATRRLREIEFSFSSRGSSAEPTRLERRIARFPYVPGDRASCDERCYEAYNIQVAGLSQRLSATGIEKLVIGVSGGLDSTQALIVAVRTMDRLRLPRSNVLAYTMPGFATSQETYENALELMRVMGVTAGEIDIRPSCEQMFRDIGHPFARGEKDYDLTFENVQAGERTSHLFRLANLHRALVVGTGDLSELALGWCTYGVGDHMSHYGVNVSVPKTLVRYLIEWVAGHDVVNAETAAVLGKILATEISPELVPGDDAAQSTESQIGPFELHDFFLYYTTRHGYAPSRTAFLCMHAWAKDLPGAAADAPYRVEEILHWLRVFLERFFATSQFKRSAIPNGPKVGSGGSLSPRGDWRAPSDSSAAPWLAGLEQTRAWIERSL